TSATINLAQASAAAIGGACETGLDVVLSFGTPAIEKKVPCVNSAYSTSLDVSSQPDGSLTLKASQVDEAGNTSALVSFIANKDVVPPTLNLISLNPTGANRATQTSISLNLECEAGLSVAFESPAALTTLTPINCNGTAGTNPILNNSFSVAGLADSAAPIDLKLSMTDAVGNKTTKAISLLYKDVVSGTPTITVAKAFTNKFQTFSGTCTIGEGDVKLLIKRGDATDTTKSVACASDGTWKIENFDASTLTAADGSMTAKASQTDAAGNSTVTMPSAGFTYDTAVPTGTFNLTTAQQVLNISEASSLLTVGGQCEAGTTLSLTVTPVTATALLDSPTCSTGGTWSATLDYRSVPTSTTASTITLRITDLAGNVTSLNKNITLDLIAPTPAITLAGVPGNDSRRYVNFNSVSAVSVSANCEVAVPTMLLIKDTTSAIKASKSVPCSASTIFETMNLNALAEGDFNLTIQQVDDAGNVGTSANYALVKDTIKPSTPTALLNLQDSNSNTLSATPQFTVVSAPDAGGIYDYTYFIFDSAETLLKGGVFKNATSTITYPLGFSVAQTYKLKVRVNDYANNVSEVFADTWDYCPYAVKEFGPTPANKPNANDTLSETLKIPRSCARGNISIIAVGESGRMWGGGFDGVKFRGNGGLAAGLFNGSALAGRTLRIDFGGAGLGGRSGSGVNNGAGGRYAWVEDSADASLARVVAGGGGGAAGAALETQYANTPGLGGDSGLGGGDCEDGTGQYRHYCGKNGNSDGNGAAGAVGKPGGCTIAPNPEPGVSASASVNRGKGGNATNPGTAVPQRSSGGGGGGFGGGGAGSNGLTGDCFGRSGGAGGSDVSGAALYTLERAAINKIAGINYNLPHVKIVLGLPAKPCPTGDWIYVPGGGYSTNGLNGRSDAGFCVSRSEMAVVGGAAAPASAGAPARGMTFVQASANCSSIDNSTSNYKIINNSQWQTLALITHWNSSNWARNSVGYAPSNDNKMATGQFNTLGSLDVPDNDTNPCAYTTANSCALNSWNVNKRALSLGNNAWIWDLNSNGAEWVQPVSKSGDPANYGDMPVTSIDPEMASPFTNARASLGTTLDYSSIATKGSADFGLGRIRLNYTSATNGLLRGGSSTMTTENELGVFSADFSIASGAAPARAAFRCIYQPSAPGF
ncbi:MAG: hypothetical protein EOP12_03445, partial [Pseudomonas sp.]